jgi:trimethylamine--corrinoid protein Co-methyltransferase
MVNPVSHTDLEGIDRAAKALLEDPGIKVEHDEIVDLLLKKGARRGAKTQEVRFPEEMVAEYIALAPSTVNFADRSGGAIQVTPDSESRFWTGAALFYLPGREDKGGLRPVHQSDLADFTRIVHHLSNVDTVVGTSIEDVPPPHRDFVGFRTMAQNTRKHIRTLSFTPKGGEVLIEMARVLSEGSSLKERPLFSIGFTAHGPLRWTNLALGVYRATAGYGIPCTVNGEPMAGASSPVTLAGAAAVGTAEILSGIVINQVLEPRRPCLFNLGFAHVMDMRKAFAVTGGPENVLLAVTGAELARFYNLPSVSWMCTDSLDCDEQNALEKMMAAVAHCRARVSTVWGVGQVESEKTISPVQAVIDDEIVAMVRRLQRGFDVNDETLALEVIRKVGIAGSFLATDHTLAHFKSELFEPSLLVREQRVGVKEGSESEGLRDRAEQRVASLLKAQAEPVLDEKTEAELMRIEKNYSS